MRSRDDAARRRETMVQSQIVSRGIRDGRALDAMRRVPRERFVLEDDVERAFDDRPLPIGCCQTISQPYIVALMTERLRLSGSERVLEIGTGCGYQTAILAELALEVFTIEIVSSLAERARRLLDELGYRNIRFRAGDGADGWRECAPFDRILVTAAPKRFPAELGEQLVVGGWAVAPIGETAQELHRIRRTATGFETEGGIAVRFVPMTGRASDG